MRDPRDSVWTYIYDSLGRRIRETDPDRGTWAYDYNAAGELVEQTDARDERTTFAYDDLGRPTVKTVRACPPQSGSPAALDTHGYIGEREDGEDRIGLVYLNARVYDPKMGRFLSPDSLDPTLPGGAAPTAMLMR